MRFTPFLILLVACEEYVNPAGPVEAGQHTCPGARVDDLFRDIDGTLWLGCGEAADGTGLHRSTDGGGSWEEVEGFETFRVSSISQPSDGLLYVAGTEVGGPHRVRSYDGSTVAPVFTSANQLWNSFHVGTYVQQDTGLAIAESLTGAGMAVRQRAGATWQDASPWSAGSYQMLDALDADGVLLGAGSTITQPPTVFVQSQGAAFDAYTLDDSFAGELWSIDHHQGLFAVGGVDQDADVGVVFATTGDPRDVGGWSSFRVDTGQSTWIRDVCVNRSRLVAVGAFSTRDTGLAYESTDAGRSWGPLDLPDDAPGLWSCWLDDDGLWMVGSDGFVATR